MSYITDKVDELFVVWNKPDSPGCSLAIIKEGEIIYKRGYGMADLERNIPLSPASVFDIGSMGKQFTAMLIAILARQGALSLDDPIRKYIPEMPAYAQPVTIRHLIHHTSGLRDYTTLMYLSGMRFENFYYEEELLDLVCRQKASNYQPGDKFLYTNTNYLLLGVVAKRAAGKSLPALLQEYILDPLGMKATSFGDDLGRIVKNRAIGYSPTEGGFRNEMTFCGGFGDGAILSSVEDLFLWEQNFHDNKLGGGGNELIQEILTPGRLNNGEKLNYAYGLFIDQYTGLKTIQHAGGWAGYCSDMSLFPEQNFSVICLANLNSIEPWMLTAQVAEIYLADLLKEKERPTSQKTAESIELTPSQMTPSPFVDYVGVYRSEELSVPYKFLLNGEQLCFRRGYSTPETLQPVAKDCFQAGDLHFQFERDEHDHVYALTIRTNLVWAIRFSRCLG